MSKILLRTRWLGTYSKSPQLFVLNRTFSSSSSDDEKVKKPSKAPTTDKKSNDVAINKLNQLLQQITMAGNDTNKKLNLAKPRGRNAKTEPGVKSSKVETIEQKLVSAVKDVASSLGGNTAQTESELLSKVVHSNEVPVTNLSDIVKGMKIDRESKQEHTASRAQQIKKLQANKQQKMEPREKPQKFQRRQTRQIESPEAVSYEPINIFGAEPLGIFNVKDFTLLDKPMNNTWNNLYERELKLAVTHPPANYFQEQILWTEQGKLWKFPIDNEQGMEDEQNVYFADHVFLEEHLEPWCPSKGPLRHFMELVCVGLSKNPYMSVKDKLEHLKWFETYFESKKKLLQEVGAMPALEEPVKQVNAK